ncbi:hypothetical protein [Denitrobacterium detoxificans]|uniref:hypothetical protein n=1 Tax=Denitrobacterium detoxificans TaxID=79604 RepID=UPI0026EE09C6|nr:hypothetical protein [Denitrobacterium detoxificans]MBE6466628.1 hypothetical protein [Denitrobacterium detoxificans]
MALRHANPLFCPCGDTSGSLVVMRQGSKAADVLVEGSGYRDVHVNGDKVALCVALVLAFLVFADASLKS